MQRHTRLGAHPRIGQAIGRVGRRTTLSLGQEVGDVHRRRVALDQGLTHYQPFLEGEGYEVADLTTQGAKGVDAVLLSGGDRDMTGMTDRTTDAFVLDVTGRQPEEVLYDLSKHFRLQGDGPLSPV